MNNEENQTQQNSNTVQNAPQTNAPKKVETVGINVMDGSSGINLVPLLSKEEIVKEEKKQKLNKSSIAIITALIIVTSIVVGRKISDSLAGFKAIRKNKFRKLNLTERHFGYEAETVVKSIRMHYRLVEVPVSYTRRNTGISQVSPLKDGFLILKSIIKARLAPLK